MAKSAKKAAAASEPPEQLVDVQNSLRTASPETFEEFAQRLDAVWDVLNIYRDYAWPRRLWSPTQELEAAYRRLPGFAELGLLQCPPLRVIVIASCEHFPQLDYDPNPTWKPRDGDPIIHQYFWYARHPYPWSDWFGCGRLHDPDDPINERADPKLAGELLLLLEEWQAMVKRCRALRSTNHIEESPTNTGHRDAGLHELVSLERTTPALELGTGKWVDNKRAAVIEGLGTRSLATYRSSGRSLPDGSFGVDIAGRIWRREGTPGSHPWYLKATLKTVN